AGRVGANDAAAVRQEFVEPVRGDDREERRTERDEQVSADPCLAFPELALEADCSTEPTGDREPRERLPTGERRDLTHEELQWPPPGTAAAPQSRPLRDRAARRGGRVRTAPSRPSPAPSRSAR